MSSNPQPRIHVLCLSPESVVREGLEQYADRWRDIDVEVLADRSQAGVRAGVGDADYVIGDWTGELGLDEGDISAADRCGGIFQPTAGYQTIDAAAAARNGIPVANAPGANAGSVAEWVVMAILAAMRNVIAEDRALRAGEWRMVAAAEEGIWDLAGRVVGIVGFGAIGQGVAHRLRGFDVGRILCSDAYEIPGERLRELGAEQVSLDQLVDAADVVTLHVPLTPQTRHLITRDRLAQLGPGAVLVNASRGAVVDEDALVEALTSGRLSGAALDVFEEEPLGPGHRWSEVPRTLLSPHLSGSTVEARRRMVAEALDNLDGVLRGGAPRHVVNG